MVKKHIRIISKNNNESINMEKGCWFPDWSNCSSEDNANCISIDSCGSDNASSCSWFDLCGTDNS